jgi:hypothetical protein
MIRRRSEDDPMEGEAGTALTLVNLVAGRFAGQLARQQQQPAAVKAAASSSPTLLPLPLPLLPAAALCLLSTVLRQECSTLLPQIC